MIQRLVRFRADPRSEAIWLTIYADIMTNLMLVFLALYGLTVMGNDALKVALDSIRNKPVDSLTPATFKRLAPALEETVGAIPGVSVIEEAGAVRLRFGENVLFPSGSATLKSTAREPLVSVAALLRVLPHTIVVEGHTDPVPVSIRSGFKNNEELSLARSMAVVRLLMDQGGLPAGQIAAAAYGEHRPISPNESALGRRLNRRVEIAIFRDFPFSEAPKPGPVAP